MRTTQYFFVPVFQVKKDLQRTFRIVLTLWPPTEGFSIPMFSSAPGNNLLPPAASSSLEIPLLLAPLVQQSHLLVMPVSNLQQQKQQWQCRKPLCKPLLANSQSAYIHTYVTYIHANTVCWILETTIECCNTANLKYLNTVSRNSFVIHRGPMKCAGRPRITVNSSCSSKFTATSLSAREILKYCTFLKLHISRILKCFRFIQADLLQDFCQPY